MPRPHNWLVWERRDLHDIGRGWGQWRGGGYKVIPAIVSRNRARSNWPGGPVA